MVRIEPGQAAFEPRLLCGAELRQRHIEIRFVLGSLVLGLEQQDADSPR